MVTFLNVAFNCIRRKTDILIRVQVDMTGYLKVILKIDTVQLCLLDIDLPINLK